jgi:hypothetical protein
MAMERYRGLDGGTKMSISYPKFLKCSSPICPLDERWDRRSMLDDEPVCFYVIEHSKESSRSRFDQRGLGDLYEVIERVLPEQSSKWGKLGRTYERAKISGSRLEKSPIWVKEKACV